MLVFISDKFPGVFADIVRYLKFQDVIALSLTCKKYSGVASISRFRPAYLDYNGEMKKLHDYLQTINYKVSGVGYVVSGDVYYHGLKILREHRPRDTYIVFRWPTNSHQNIAYYDPYTTPGYALNIHWPGNMIECLTRTPEQFQLALIMIYNIPESHVRNAYSPPGYRLISLIKNDNGDYSLRCSHAYCTHTGTTPGHNHDTSMIPGVRYVFMSYDGLLTVCYP